jgi:hypothetical protein
MPVEPIQWMLLRPYVSLIILECTADDHALAFRLLVKLLGEPGRQVPNKVTGLVAVSPADDEVPAPLTEVGIDQAAGYVHRHELPPAWSLPDGGFIDTRHELTLVLRRERFVVVRAGATLSRAVQKWLNGPARPYRRIEPEVLEGAMFTRGCERSLAP